MPRKKTKPNQNSLKLQTSTTELSNIFDVLTDGSMSSDSENASSSTQLSQIKTRSMSVNAEQPDLSQLTEKQLLLKLTVDLAAVKSDVAEIKTSIEFSSKDITDLKANVTSLEKKVDDQARHIDMLNDKITSLEQRQANSEQYTRKYNLIFDNIMEEAQENLEEKFRGILSDVMQIPNADNILIDNIHRLPGRPRGTKPVIVRFVRYMDRDRVWAAKKKLYQTDIFIREHLQADVAARQRELMPVFKALKSNGETVSLTRDTITHAKRQYGVASVSQLYPVLQSTDPCAKVGEVYAYFSRHSPLSNFHKCKFEYEGKDYSCVEEAYQTQKAASHHREDLVYRITHSTDPVEMKRYGDAIDNKNWYQSGEAVRVMTAIVRAKFTQCQRPREFLVNSGDKPIAEASPTDKFWGIGVSRFNMDSQTVAKWKGKNHMGVILQKIRAEL